MLIPILYEDAPSVSEIKTNHIDAQASSRRVGRKEHKQRRYGENLAQPHKEAV
ncbi:MAG: hypothetical protein N2235_11000 [Fischerella sp.]|nr:hypothetical protein [Fischerella sp.]